MKGVVLAGGLGTRLGSLTSVTNKHLLPVYDRPMLFFPLQTLANIGIQEVLIVVGGKSTGEILRLVQDGRRFGFRRLYYTYQNGEAGIPAALLLADRFSNGDDITVILGDNIFLPAPPIARFGGGAHLFLAHVPDPSCYGCPMFEDDSLVGIVEKAKTPQNDLAVTGLYIYDCGVFEKIRMLRPSEREELEVSDLNNLYIKEGRANHSIYEGTWYDAGSSIDALTTISFALHNKENR